MSFEKGHQVEICIKEDGFQGSYYSATIVGSCGRNRYRVKYETLLNDKGTQPLVEVVATNDIRPQPPQDNETNQSFHPLDVVDAYDRDGWWIGEIVGEEGANFVVYFKEYGTEISYPASSLRMHKEWINGEWVTSPPATRAN